MHHNLFSAKPETSQKNCVKKGDRTDGFKTKLVTQMGHVNQTNKKKKGFKVGTKTNDSF